MTRKVLVLQEYVANYRVGFWRRLIKLAEDAGIQVEIAAGAPGGVQALRGDVARASFIRPIRQTEFSILGKRIVFRDTSAVRRGADLVILEQARRNIDAYKLLVPRMFRSSKVALWGHGRDYVSTSSAFSRRLVALLTKRADWFFAYTSGGRDAVVEIGLPADRVTVVQNTIDTGDLIAAVDSISVSEVEAYAALRGLTGKTALFIGGLDGSKRVPFLLHAGKVAHDADPEFRLLIAGDGADRELVEEASRVHDWIISLGPISGSAKAMAIAASQIIAMPGRIGLIAIDSLSTGRPIITTEWPWHAPEYEYLTPNATCVVTENDEKSYGRALAEILQDKDRLTGLGLACRAEASTYSIDEMARRFLGGIQDALRGSRAV